MNQLTKKKRVKGLDVDKLNNEEVLKEMLKKQVKIEEHLNSIKTIILFCFALGMIVLGYSMFM